MSSQSEQYAAAGGLEEGGKPCRQSVLSVQIRFQVKLESLTAPQGKRKKERKKKERKKKRKKEKKKKKTQTERKIDK